MWQRHFLNPVHSANSFVPNETISHFKSPDNTTLTCRVGHIVGQLMLEKYELYLKINSLNTLLYS